MATKKKVNKSKWIRSQPATMSAADVVKKAKAEGMTISTAFVYTARSSAKKAKGAPKGKPGRPKGSKNAAPKAVAANSSSLLETLHKLAWTYGFKALEEATQGLKRSAGL